MYELFELYLIPAAAGAVIGYVCYRWWKRI
jgi:hypothetical protein